MISRPEPIPVCIAACADCLHTYHEKLKKLLKAQSQLWTLDAKGLVGLVLLNDSSSAETVVENCQEMLKRSIPLFGIDVSDRGLAFQHSWELLSLGLSDVFSWSQQGNFLDWISQRVLRTRQVDTILQSKRVQEVLVGESTIWQKTLRQVIEAACYSTAPVMVLGESGTGKELVSRLIHELDVRPNKEEMVLLDCSTLVPELFGSEFFGHEKGAYTNAVTMRDGAFARAHMGTLFLDEVGELPLQLQAALLRVIQEGSYKRLGGNLWKKTNFRLISATNRPLEKAIEVKAFREDFFYRISTLVIRLPPLRERRLDIPDLVQHFARKILKCQHPPRLGPYLRQYLMTRDYPGNVRELRQLVHRLMLKYPGEGPLTIGNLPETEMASTGWVQNIWQEPAFNRIITQALAQGIGLKDIKRHTGDVALKLAIEAADHHLPTAADRLGVSERLVQGWWKEQG